MISRRLLHVETERGRADYSPSAFRNVSSTGIDVML